jgi:hypothetical protein
MATQYKRVNVTISENHITPHQVIYSGQYELEVPVNYTAELITGDDIVYDNEILVINYSHHY